MKNKHGLLLLKENFGKILNIFDILGNFKQKCRNFVFCFKKIIDAY